MKETTTQKKRRQEKARLKLQQKRSMETESEKEVRLAKARLKLQQKRSMETESEKEVRLAKARLKLQQKRSMETESEKEVRLAKARLKLQQKRSMETESEKEVRLAKRRKAVVDKTEAEYAAHLARERERKHKVCAVETAEKRSYRLSNDKDRKGQARAVETAETRSYRLAKQAIRQSQARAVETDEDRSYRLGEQNERQQQMREAETEEGHQESLSRIRVAFAERSSQAEEFFKTINIFCDKTCDICTKQCYPNQVVKYNLVAEKSYLPPELAGKAFLEVCHRCNTHLKSRNTQAPPQAYWNNLDPGKIPDVITALTQPEQRLLSRIIPFIKVIKFYGRFGQFGFKGHATLFALDIFEVSEKLPDMLPRSSNDANIVIIIETLENLNVSRDYTISRDRIYAALHWLIANNPLYKDVRINNFARLETQDIIRVIPPAQPQHEQEQVDPTVQDQSRRGYKSIGNVSRIVRASWNQGNGEIFSYPSKQCFAMALANIVKAAILSPAQWNTKTLNGNMLAGDQMYATIRELTVMNDNAFPIPESGYLELRNLDLIRNDFIMYEGSYSLEYSDDWLCQGKLKDNENDGEVFKTLLGSLRYLFSEHSAGILISQSKSLGLMCFENKYYFTDSHSCGPKGAPLDNNNGKGCVIQCDSIEELHRICRRVLHSANVQFSIHYINVILKGNFMQMEDYLRQHAPEQLIQYQAQNNESSISFEPDTNAAVLTEHVHVQTSMMAPIDVAQPDVEDEFNESRNVNEIMRKTGGNIVNLNHEKKAEELGFFQLFPRGINGLHEDRPVRITPLQYFQIRVSGKDPRFQKDNYLCTFVL